MTSASRSTIRRLLALVIVLVVSGGYASLATAHPLGNFTINQYAHIDVGKHQVTIRCVVDMAEIPAFNELQIIDSDSNGLVSQRELEEYGQQAAGKYASGLMVRVDDESIALSSNASRVTTPPGVGNLPTLRVEFDIAGPIPGLGVTARRLRFENTNYRDRLGWREIVVAAGDWISVFDTEAYGNGLTNELRAYPEESLSAPLDERACELSFVSGVAPAGARGLLTRDGRLAVASRDRLAELIMVPEMTPSVVLLGLLVAAMLGSIHALSPGHGKTVVGAYLVGSRGTARHAAFLGLTVTVTHTVGVFALGLATLFASRYIVPEKLFPILSLVSGGIVLAMGAGLFARRLRATLQRGRSEMNHHVNAHGHSHGHSHDHSHDHLHDHLHVGGTHTHLPPGADGSRVTWRSLLALGVSGGLLPCPSALIVLLSAISLHRVGYGLVLVVAFSVGLAATLTAVGLVFVYAGRVIKRSAGSGRLVRLLPVLSAFVIMCVGAAILYQALPK